MMDMYISDWSMESTIAWFLKIEGFKRDSKRILKEYNGKGDLDLSFTDIAKLPKNLKVGGSLDLSYTKITELPNDLTVGGGLYLRGTKITEVPNDLKVGGEIYPDIKRKGERKWKIWLKKKWSF